MTALIAAVFAAAFILAAGLTPVAAALGRRLRFMDPPGGRKLQAEPIPRIGGLAIFLSLAAVAAALVWGACTCAGRLGPDAAEAAAELRAAGSTLRYGAIACGAAVIFLLGLIDDRRSLPPWLKLAVEIAVAAALVAAGVRVTALLHWRWVGWVLTVLWIVGVTNAFNLLDNMDGLSAGVAAMAAVGFAVVAAQAGEGQELLTLLFVAVAGAAAGFLVHNLHPAKVYMGDSGALLLGYLLATLSVEASYYKYSSATVVPLATPLLILAIPIYDTASVLLIRLREGRPLFVGDTSHFSHRLVAMGMSVRAAVGTIYLITLAMGIGAGALMAEAQVRGILTLVQAALMLAIVAILESAGRRRS